MILNKIKHWFSSGVVLMLVLLLSSQLGAESVVEVESLAHNPADVRFCYINPDGQLNIKLQVQKAGVEQVRLITGDGRDFLMDYYALNNFYSFYLLKFVPEADELTYRFAVNAGDEVVYYGHLGVGDAPGEFSVSVKTMQTFASPDWAKGAVIYQIFPDRFYNGDVENDPETGEYSMYGHLVTKREWDQLPENPAKGSDFFGGDLQGIITKLDYLADLGVQAIYLNPVFTALSNHKYDTADYLQIDPHFGTNELFQQLIAEAKARGIFIIIDGVFNHTGTAFWAFQDVLKKGEKSLYKDWYNIYSYPVNPVVGNYDSWNGYSSLPELNYQNPEVREYILEVVRYWLGLGVKGIRLDAPKEVPHEFWQELYRMAKEIDPEVFIIGEVWDDASPWINHREFDSTINYLYRDLMIKFFIQRNKRASSFARELGMDQTRYTEETNHVLFNLISSHDKERILTLARGQAERLKPLIFFQFTYLGAPAIYYGDEVGMEGGTDPDCRRPMIWDEEQKNQELYALFKQLIGLRRRLPALQRGTYRTVFTDDKARLLIFTREYQGQQVLVVINNSDQPYALELTLHEWGIAGKVEDLLRKEVFADTQVLDLEANAGAVLLVK